MLVGSVMDVMKMGNSMPRVGTKLTPLAFQASMLSITPPRVPDVTAFPLPICLFRSLSDPYMSVVTCKLLPTGIISLLKFIITCIHRHTQGRSNNYTVHSFTGIMAMISSVMSVMKIGNTAPRAGVELLHSRPVCS